MKLKLKFEVDVKQNITLTDQLKRPVSCTLNVFFLHRHHHHLLLIDSLYKWKYLNNLFLVYCCCCCSCLLFYFSLTSILFFVFSLYLYDYKVYDAMGFSEDVLVITFIIYGIFHHHFYWIIYFFCCLNLSA